MANARSNISLVADSAKQDGHQLQVLLVDDSPTQQVLISYLLRQLGHQVDTASDGFEALSAIQSDKRYDVILMDCQMSLMDGFQATRFIRKLEHLTCKQIAIIGISASALPEECFEAGMDDFLRKPLNKLLLKTTLGRSIRRKRFGMMRISEPLTAAH
jgi:CheY-like chemotaxis protein